MLQQPDSNSKKKGHNIICKVFDSPNLGQVEATFCITESGINDPIEDTKQKKKKKKTKI